MFLRGTDIGGVPDGCLASPKKLRVCFFLHVNPQGQNRNGTQGQLVPGEAMALTLAWYLPQSSTSMLFINAFLQLGERTWHRFRQRLGRLLVGPVWMLASLACRLLLILVMQYSSLNDLKARDNMCKSWLWLPFGRNNQVAISANGSPSKTSWRVVLVFVLAPFVGKLASFLFGQPHPK